MKLFLIRLQGATCLETDWKEVGTERNLLVPFLSGLEKVHAFKCPQTKYLETNFPLTMIQPTP